jgi:O-antigen/teichoic acid export membrane protein
MILPIRIAQYGAFQLALGLNREIMYRSAIGLAVNLGLSIVFVGWLGSIGAVIATLITLYFVNCSLNLALISRSIRCRWWEVLPFGFITQITLLALGSVGPVLLVRIMNFSIPPTLELLLNFGIYVSSLLMISKIFHVNLFQMEIKGICKKVMKFAKT